MEVMMNTFPTVIFSLSLSLPSFHCPSVSLCAFSRSFIHLIIHSAKFAPSLLSVVLQLTFFLAFLSHVISIPRSPSLISWLPINFPSLLMGRNFCIVYHSSTFFCFGLVTATPLYVYFLSTSLCIFLSLFCIFAITIESNNCSITVLTFAMYYSNK